ncbi:type VI secretion system Vgr family protein [Paraliomyxa miuraensis]|uniref:type VI secretion system Vgr family protein n=1 Tax=Paraliomyxa miuraensis TaxID=376150 RepID=UPI002252B162|nr:type VI secretion system tip protein TssI/VgrG [Paraliomyxa miuraensis]MCX4247157.1 type VI secretion system tip protein VgrG [Paraliomyxa miuraensis]
MKSAKVLFQPGGDHDTQWTVEGLRVHDRLGEPYELHLALRTEDLSAEPTAMLGQSAAVVIEREPLHQELAGIIERVDEGDTSDHALHVTLTIVPALAALRYRRNSRIFQDLGIPQVIEQVLGEGLGPYGRSVDLSGLGGEYPPQEYTVQYRETDFDFVHRLLEENGITYRFTSDGGVETMVLSDGPTPFSELRSAGNTDGALPMRNVDGDPGLHENAHAFRRVSQLRSTVARTAVFDWHVPRPIQDGEDPSSAALSSPNGAMLGPEREDYDHREPATLYGYRSQALDFGQVQRQLELRRALHQRDAVRCEGEGTATQMTPGLKFELIDHVQSDLAGEYVLVGVEHLYGVPAGGEPESAYRNRFEAIPASVPWRPERLHSRPRIPGIQTATVVGPAGEEIFTDEHGRIKIQLHWDRGGGFDDNSSCFVRVVQPWAGNGWGTLFLPRIGMEVTVTFVDGDPDRPIVTGSLYNGTHSPPYGLPGAKTQSGIKSESSPGGGGFNELRFDDAVGAEEVYLHAQKDMNEAIGNDHATTVGNDQSLSVGNNQTIAIAVDQTQTIGGNQTESIDGNQTLTVKANQDVTVQANQSVTVQGSATHTVVGSVTETIQGGVTQTVTGGLTQTVTGGVTQTVTGGLTQTVNGSTTTTHHGAVNSTVDGSYNLTAIAGVNITAPAGMTVSAPGGICTVDPANTTEVHGFWDSTTGVSKSLTGASFGVTGASLSVTGLSVSATGVSVSATGLSVSATGAELSNEPLKLGNRGADLTTSGINLYVSGIIILM